MKAIIIYRSKYSFSISHVTSLSAALATFGKTDYCGT